MTFTQAERLDPIADTIFATMTALAAKHDAVNLGQGFPDEDGPKDMLEVAANQILNGNNQYAPGWGIHSLREAIADNRLATHGQTFNPDRGVAVTVGATEALTTAILGLVNPGDEVVVIEPYYDVYVAAIALAGAHHRSVPLVPEGSAWKLDTDRLNSVVSDSTKMIVINTPHNPTGHVFSEEELRAVADVAEKYDCIVLSDEVYEHLVFDGAHIPAGKIIGDRTLTVSSAAKTFNVTGWKTGWLMGHEDLVSAAVKAKQYVTFSGAAPLQPAVEYGLRFKMDWVQALRSSLGDRYRYLSSELSELGFTCLESRGSYFFVTDISGLPAAQGMTGMEFCRRLPELAGVAAIPVSPFVDSGYESLVRWSFCKKDSTLESAVGRLKEWVG